MLSPRIRTLAAVAVGALVVLGSVSDAFAIRNRYTNQQAQGFAALFFDEFGQPYGYAGNGYDGAPAYGPEGYDRPFRPYRGRRHVRGYDE